MRYANPILLAFAIALAPLACERPEPTSPEVVKAGPSFAAAVDVSEEKVPLDFFAAFIPCANGGLGEIAVATDPVLHIVLRTVFDGAGGFHTSGHFQPIGDWTGIGLDTGDEYVPTGVTRDNLNIPSSGSLEITEVNNFRWIGKGKASNLLVHSTFHVTFNTNGHITADVVNASVECR